MGNTIEHPGFQKTVEDVLDSLSTLYSVSPRNFMLKFAEMPKSILRELVRLRQTKKYNNTDLEDTADYASEVVYYYESYYKTHFNKKRKKKNNQPAFTLRNATDLDNFHQFLLLMVELHKLSPEHFIKMFPECPTVFWDKVDDLREASYTYKYGSVKYEACLKMSKDVSYAYSGIMDSLTLKQEEC
jgi:hypothetical protein